MAWKIVVKTQSKHQEFNGCFKVNNALQNTRRNLSIQLFVQRKYVDCNVLFHEKELTSSG